MKPGVATIQDSDDGESIEVLLADGARVAKVAVPREEVRAMLRRLIGG